MRGEGRPPIAVRLRASGLYLFTLFVVGLAGSYVAPFFLFLFYLLLFLLMVSFLYLLATFLPLKYHQEFSTEHPVKGEAVVHRLILANESPLPVHFVRVRFKSVHPGMGEVQPDFSCYLRRRGRLEREYRVHCPFRGIYTVGLEALEAEDPLHLFRLRRRVWYRTFYVYPRVLALGGFSAGLERSERPVQGSSAGGTPDTTLFSRLRGYRPGEPLRHLAWKKFAATGTPFLREYDASAEPGVAVYFDLRPAGLPGRQALETEDVSVEILVALVKYYLERAVPVAVRAPGRSFYTFQGNSPAQFPAFYRSTMELLFQPTLSPAAVYRYEAQAGGAEGASAVFVTHLFDPQVFALLEESLGGDNPLSLVLNRCGIGEGERRRAMPYLRSLSERGAHIRLVSGPQTIREELEGEPAW
jgi:uncharacterized protein (DUF58 family)